MNFSKNPYRLFFGSIGFGLKPCQFHFYCVCALILMDLYTFATKLGEAPLAIDAQKAVRASAKDLKEGLSVLKPKFCRSGTNFFVEVQ